MLDIKNLERRWLYYKIEKALPFAILSVFSLLILFIILAFLQSQKVQKIKKIPLIKKEEEKKHLNIKKVEKKQPIQTSSFKEEKEVKQLITLTPSLSFIDKISIEEPKTIKPQIENTTVERQETPKEEEKSKIVIQHQDSRKDIQDVLKRFHKNNNPVLSLFIAKKYYELKEYKNAYNYALITNNLDTHIEDSWIIFAKSLVKLGKKQMAIDTLKQYVNHSNSKKASMLLHNIQNGKFK